MNKSKIARNTFAFLIPFLLVGTVPLPHLSPKYNLLAVIAHIRSNNDAILSVNEHITGHMTQIKDLSGTTAEIGSKLSRLKQGIGEQGQSLTQLSDLSQQEIDLSTNLNRLASQLNSDLKTIRQSSRSQEQSIQQMKDATAAIALLADQLQSENQQVAEKVLSAAKLTDQVDQSIP